MTDDSKLAHHAIGLIDHTSLGLEDTEEKIVSLIDAAVAAQPHTAAICIYPKFIKLARSLQEKSPEKYPRSLRVATVVNFPGGDEAVAKVVEDTKEAVKDGADEVDLVIDYKLLKQDVEKGKAAAEALTKAVREACPADSVLLKVIIESGELQEDVLIRAACEAAIAGGADYVKTSTGKVKVNATIQAAEVMLKAANAAGPDRVVGFKAAGGVRGLSQTREFLELAAGIFHKDTSKWEDLTPRQFRFGASSLLGDLRPATLKRKLEEADGGEPPAKRAATEEAAPAKATEEAAY